jgi:hypothetical protein
MSEKKTETAAAVTESDIAEAAANPSSFSVDGLSQTNRSLSELIAADKYLRKRSLLKRRAHPLLGLVSKVIPSGPCDC